VHLLALLLQALRDHVDQPVDALAGVRRDDALPLAGRSRALVSRQAMKALERRMDDAEGGDGSETWANPATHQSAESWCRAVGWFGVAAVQILDLIPADHPRRAELPERLAKGRAALAVMEEHLSTRQFFVNERYSIADIALYAYTHVAEDGGHDLKPYPNLREWLGRVAAQPNYVPLLAKPK